MLPSNGVAASPVSSISRAFWTPSPLTLYRLRLGAGHDWHGPLNHVLPHVSYGAVSNVAHELEVHLFQLVGQCESVHRTEEVHRELVVVAGAVNGVVEVHELLGVVVVDVVGEHLALLDPGLLVVGGLLELVDPLVGADNATTRLFSSDSSVL